MTLSSDRDTKQKKDGVWGYWLRVHPRARCVEVVLANDGDGAVRVGQVVLKDNNDGDETAPPPACDVVACTTQPYQGNIVHDETVLMLSRDGAPARGGLFFQVPRVLSVRDARLEVSYEEGRDFTVDGQDLVCLPGSRMPQMKDTDFAGGDLKWYNISGKHVCVTYEHPMPGFSSTQFTEDWFPATIRLLRARAPLTVVSYGDSITFGLNVSRKLRVPPYMPTWAQLVVGRMQKDYDHDAITLYDSSLSGGDSAGAARLAARMVGTLLPDLVLVGFGMNDFWSTDPPQFGTNIKKIIDDVREKKPTAEFILIAPMCFDPEYTREAKHHERLAGYTKVLRDLECLGVKTIDVTSITKMLYAGKKPKDFLTDPLHPNDFLARIYASGIYQFFDQGTPRTGPSP
jgi:lysophospholipase L1-like esterase